MSRFRKIHVCMYADEMFRNLSDSQPNGKYLWIYLLTGPHTTNIPGLSTIGENALAEAVGWDLKDFRKVFQEVLSKGCLEVDWKARVVWIPNAIKYNSPESPNVIKGWSKSWKEIPECELKVSVYKALKDFAKDLPKGFTEAFNQTFTDPSANQKQKQKQKQEPTSACADGLDPSTADAGVQRPEEANDVGKGSKRHRKDESAKPEHGEIVRYFTEHWQARYGVHKAWNGKDNSHVKWLLDQSNRDPATVKNLIDTYLRDEDPWLKRNTHSIGILVSRLDTYRVKAEDRSDPSASGVWETDPEEARKLMEEIANANTTR